MREDYLTQQARVKYVDDYLISQEFSPGLFGQYKLSIPVKRKLLDIAFKTNKQHVARHFIFQNEDSVFFLYQSLIYGL